MHVVTGCCRTPAEDYYDGLLAGQAYLHSLGVTGWQDAIVGNYAGMDDPGPTYLAAAQRGDLTAHVVGRCGGTATGATSRSSRWSSAAQSYTHGRFRATSVKVMQDGVAENGTAALTAPYLDRCGHATDNSGHSFVDPLALRRYVARLDAEGFQVHVHAIGDRGVREALDAFEGTRPRRDRRHHIAHLQLVHPDDVRRFAELGVAANIQALWACLDDQMAELTMPFLGEERAPGSTRSATCTAPAPGSWPAATGRSAPPTRSRRSTSRSTGGPTARRGRAGQRAVPARAGARPRDRVRGVHQRVGVGEPPRRRRHPRARAGGRPRRARPRPVRRRRRPRSARPGWCPPGSTASAVHRRR